MRLTSAKKTLIFRKPFFQTVFFYHDIALLLRVKVGEGAKWLQLINAIRDLACHGGGICATESQFLAELKRQRKGRLILFHNFSAADL